MCTYICRITRYNDCTIYSPIANLNALFHTNMLLVVWVITTIRKYDPFITSEVSTLLQTFVDPTETNLAIRTMTSCLDLIGDIKRIRLKVLWNFLKITLNNSTALLKRQFSEKKKRSKRNSTTDRCIYTSMYASTHVRTYKTYPNLSVHCTCYQREPDNH